MLGSSLVEALGRGVAALGALGIDYAVVGGIAATVRGRVRSTRDCDVLVLASKEDMLSLKVKLRELGFSHLDRADRHVLEDVVLYRFWFPVEASGFSLSLDIQATCSDFHRDVVRRAATESFGPIELQVASREDLILLKLISWRPIDRADAINLLALASALDEDYVRRQVRRFDVEERWEEVFELGHHD